MTTIIAPHLANYNLEVILTPDELQMLVNGNVPDSLKAQAIEILSNLDHPINRFFRVHIRENDHHYDAVIAVNKSLLKTYTVDQVADTVLINWYSTEDNGGESCLENSSASDRDNFYFNADNYVRVRSGGAPEEINQHEYKRLQEHISGHVATELDLMRVVNYRAGKEAKYWHPDEMPEVYIYHDGEDVEDGRYMAIDFLRKGEPRVLLVPYMDIVWELSEPEDDELEDELNKRWQYFAEAGDAEPKFLIQGFYDRFGDPTTDD